MPTIAATDHYLSWSLLRMLRQTAIRLPSSQKPNPSSVLDQTLPGRLVYPARLC